MTGPHPDRLGDATVRVWDSVPSSERWVERGHARRRLPTIERWIAKLDADTDAVFDALEESSLSAFYRRIAASLLLRRAATIQASASPDSSAAEAGAEKRR